MSPSLESHPSGGRTWFGPYELVRYLAAGGMADLYLARSGRLPGHDLVVKRIQARYVSHTRVVKMFIDEGRIAQLLEHPNIVRVVDVGIEEGAYYIAMEYIPGHDLVAIGRKSAQAGIPIPRQVAVAICAQVASGLSHAHDLCGPDGRPLRIVHCDVSPGNVVVSSSGVAKIVDFGIARATIALREEDGVAGKYNYMAPEQVEGGAVDARADLFSLGVILWELTTGRRLFKGRPEVVLKKVMEDPIPSPLDVAPGYPPALARLVMKLLERDRDARFPSAASFLEELGDYLAAEERLVELLDVAAFLRTLFDAPRTEPDDSTVIVEDAEVDRGMPGAESSPRLPSITLASPALATPPAAPPERPTHADARSAGVEGDGPTAAISLDATRPAISPRDPDATELVRLSPTARPIQTTPARAVVSPARPAKKPAARPGPSTFAVLVACGSIVLALLVLAWLATAH